MFQRGELGGITGIDPVERWFELFGDGPQSGLHGIPTPNVKMIKTQKGRLSFKNRVSLYWMIGVNRWTIKFEQRRRA